MTTKLNRSKSTSQQSQRSTAAPIFAEPGWSAIREGGELPVVYPSVHTALILADALRWMADAPEHSIHAIVTDPPYGLLEYEDKDHDKLLDKVGGVWRLPPAFDGANRIPVPRFTVLTAKDRERLTTFFQAFAFHALRVLVPGGHIIIASNPLLSTTTFHAIETAGFEKRGEIIRVVKTLRGGDRPKGAEEEFPGVTVMPKSCWEPWGVFRKPISEETVAANLRRWKAGGLRRLSDSEPFRDMIECAPASKAERAIAPHPSIKPQKLMRQLVRAALPLGVGIIYDPFTGSGSTLAAAESLGYHAVGTERHAEYFAMGASAIPRLAALPVKDRDDDDGATE